MISRIEYEFPKGAFGKVPGAGPVPAEDTTFRSTNEFTAFVSASTQPLTQLYKATLALRLSKAALEADREKHRAAR